MHYSDTLLVVDAATGKQTTYYFRHIVQVTLRYGLRWTVWVVTQGLLLMLSLVGYHCEVREITPKTVHLRQYHSAQADHVNVL